MTDKKVKIRDRARTCEKILNAVGQIIRQKGIGSVNSLAVARTAGVNRVLVHRYFGTRSNLIKAYLSRGSGPPSATDKLLDALRSAANSRQAAEFSQALKHALRHVWENVSVQRELMAEITGGGTGASGSLDKVFKPALGAQIASDKEDFNAMLALMFGAICYLGMSLSTDRRVLALDLNEEGSFERIGAVIDHAVTCVFARLDGL